MIVLYYKEKLTPQTPLLPFSSISHLLFLFSQAFLSLPLQTQKKIQSEILPRYKKNVTCLTLYVHEFHIMLFILLFFYI